MYTIQYYSKHCAASLYPYYTWWRNMSPWHVIMRCNRNMVIFGKTCVRLDKSWRWQKTGMLWLSCRNEMRDPIVVGLHVWRGEDGRGVETRELWQGQQVSLDWLNFEMSFHKQSLNQLHYLWTPTHTWMQKWDVPHVQAWLSWSEQGTVNP